MAQANLTAGNVLTYQGDLPADVMKEAFEAGRVAWDIETSGLDWQTERMGTCQIYFSDVTHIVQVSGATHPNLQALLESAKVEKVFHHAMFDLRFMAHRWPIEVKNVACTKVLSKVLYPKEEDHSLKSLLRRHLGVEISKEQRTSDWFRKELRPAQVRYAAEDVVYLISLVDRLMDLSVGQGTEEIVNASFSYIPYRVKLDLSGSGDVFTY